MMGKVPAGARVLAARLSTLFERDVELVKRLGDAQRRLLGANDRLWSGLHPDVLGVVYGETGRAATGRSAITERMIDAAGVGVGRREVETAMLGALQEAHWAIRRAFIDYQSASEERRQLAVDVGELSQRFVEELTGAGWSEEAARSADVHQLAGAH
ncbi:MAG TPA: hypothetical protein VLV25_06360 [Steroidobacteraceae bacterium]|nr:hypothetical protein [Steroidobacteraceae bacterium]